MPSYDFKTLSNIDFEELTRDLLQMEWGLMLESFKPGKDQGIDLRHISPSGSKTIIQCKHYAASGFNSLLRTLKNDELPKIKKLQPERYILATSVPLSPAQKSKIKEACSPYIISDGDVLGNDELNNLLGKFDEIEKKNFKLWLTSQAVLDRVLNNASVVKSEFEVQEIAAKIPIYVQNDSFPKASTILDKHNFVIISGSPGIGKTTLAEMLIYQHLEHNYIPVIVELHNLDEAIQRFDNSKPMIFYFDDFLGQTFLGDSGNVIHDQSLLRLIRIIQKSKNAKLVMTTREYILQNALKAYEKLDHSELMDIKYVLELDNYTKTIRARILYNHLYFSDLGISFLESIAQDQTYRKIINHANYSPRIIEWMTTLTNLVNVSSGDYPAFFLHSLDNPEQLWKHAFNEQISFAGQTLLWCLLAQGGASSLNDLESLFDKFYEYSCNKYNYFRKSLDFKAALKELDGSFINISKTLVHFYNPSVRDFLQQWLHQNPDYALDIIKTAECFSQINHIWGFLADNQNHDLDKFITQYQNEIFTAVERLIDRPHGHMEKDDETYIWSFAEQDASFSSRIPTLTQLAHITKDSNYLKLIPQILESTKQQGFHGDDGIVDWANMLNLHLPSEIINDSTLDEIVQTLKTFIIENATHANWLEDYVTLADIDSHHPLNVEERDSISNAFQGLDAEHELSYLSSSSEIEEYLATYQKINNEFGGPAIDTPSNYDEVLQQAVYEEEHAETQNHDGWEKFQQKAQLEHEHIDHMFSALTDK
ncbi:restriction endonuclease [Magnetovibrio sp. PR-2]|uniref:nSTAND3 domain-containing NTPase n=1 Tax=Magnetovibrio sp. PR-2 TaxID=3120356 RepID=UPI002FCE29FC